MTLDSSPVMNEVNQILGQGALPVHYEWTMELTLPNNQGTLKPHKVLSIDLDRDYDANYCDEILIDVVFGVGTFQHFIVPNAMNLLATLYRHPVRESGDAPDQTQDIDQQVFRAVIKDQASLAVEGSTIYAGNVADANLVGLRKVTFQLIDLAIEQTRMQSFGTVFRKTTVGDAIKYAVTKIAQTLQVDSDHQIKGVDMVDPNNTDVYEMVVIPHGVNAVDIPRYIAHHSGAPYASGFGAYLQKSIWYLYPLYDLKLYDKATKKRTLTVINVPVNRFPRTDRSFRVTPNQVIILATEGNKHHDFSERAQLSIGNGARYLDANQALSGFADIKDNVATVQRVKNANEYVAEQRSTGFNNVRISERKVTSNTYAEMSKIAPRLGSYVQVGWVNSEPGLIYPGMPVKYMYEVEGQLYSLKGQVKRAQTQIAQMQPGLFPGPHRSSTALTLFVEKKLTWDTPDNSTPST